MRFMACVFMALCVPELTVAQFNSRPTPKQGTPVQKSLPKVGGGTAKPVEAAIADLAKDLSQSMKDKKTKSFSVVPLRNLESEKSNVSGKTVNGIYFSERLTTELFKQGDLRIIERTELAEILKEHKLGESGVIDKKTALKMGEIAGVEALIIGSYMNRGTFLAVNCRVVDCRSGEVIGAAGVDAQPDENLSRGNGQGSNQREFGAEELPILRVFKDAHWRIELQATELKDGQVIATISIENVTKDLQFLWVETQPNQPPPDFASLVGDDGSTWSVALTTMYDRGNYGLGGALQGITNKNNSYQANAKRNQQIAFKPEPQNKNKPNAVTFRASLCTYNAQLAAKNQNNFVQKPFDVIDVTLENIPVPLIQPRPVPPAQPRRIP